MAYADQQMSGNKMIALVIVAIIHIFVGYALVTGLAYQAASKIIERVTTVDIDEPPPPPPPEDEPPPPPQPDTAPPPPVAPPPPINIAPAPPPIRTQPTIPPPAPPVLRVPPPAPPAPPPPPPPKFTPKSAEPRNSGWVTNADYRSSWINREYSGTASFSLRVGANGRVESCSITGGSAPQELKDATCSLIQRRARFKPATNGNGDEVAGNYSSTVSLANPRLMSPSPPRPARWPYHAILLLLSERTFAMTIDLLAAAAESPNQFGFVEAIQQGGFIAMAILAVLVIMSVGSFYILIPNCLSRNPHPQPVQDRAYQFWRAPTLREGAAKLDKNSAWRQLVEDGLAAEDQHGKMTDSLEAHDWLHGSLARSESSINARLAGGLPFLATVGATAPFVGLLGTVIGIYRALIKIALAGSASMDKVAGPVGEALIMTAIGLLVAVPAVLAYNWLMSRNKRISELLSGFSTDLLANINSKGTVKPAMITKTSTQQAGKAAATAPATKPATATATATTPKR